MYTPVNTSFTIKSGVEGVYITRACYSDEIRIISVLSHQLTVSGVGGSCSYLFSFVVY